MTMVAELHKWLFGQPPEMPRSHRQQTPSIRAASAPRRSRALVPCMPASVLPPSMPLHPLTLHTIPCPWLQAGGKGSTGFKRVLDIVPEKVGVHMLAG